MQKTRSQHTIQFITMAEDKYVNPLVISITQALKFYPDSLFYVYDVGLSKSTRKKLQSLSANIIIEKWIVTLVPIRIKHSFTSYRNMILLYLKTAVYNFRKHKKHIGLLEQIYAHHDFEIKIFNKFLIIQHHNTKHKKPFIFLDADAFLINDIDELLEDDFDLGVTLRRFSEIEYTYNNCNVLNVGILLFLGKYQTNTALITAWHNALKENTELYCEQTALTRLLHRSDPTIFDTTNSTKTITLAEQNIRIRILPCDIYNFNWIEEFDVEKHSAHVKVLHFKSERFKTPLFKKMMHTLNLTYD